MSERDTPKANETPDGGASARDLMTHNPHCVRVDTDVISAVQLMVKHAIRHLPVIDKDGVLLGVVSERDLRSALGYAALSMSKTAHHGATPRVGAAMSTAPVTVGPEASLVEMAQQFVDRRVGALVVVDAGCKVVGVVSYVDVIRWVLLPQAPLHA